MRLNALPGDSLASLWFPPGEGKEGSEEGLAPLETAVFVMLQNFEIASIYSAVFTARFLW